MTERRAPEPSRRRRSRKEHRPLDGFALPGTVILLRRVRARPRAPFWWSPATLAHDEDHSPSRANWRNFKSVDIDVPKRLFILGPNASGKSNLLDAIRFLRDLTMVPGGLQYAVPGTGWLKSPEVLERTAVEQRRATLVIALGDDKEPRQWEYELSFTRRSPQRYAAHRRGRNRSKERRGRHTSPDPPEDDMELLRRPPWNRSPSTRRFRPVAEFLWKNRLPPPRAPDRPRSVAERPGPA